MERKPFKAADGPYLMLIAFAYMLLAQLAISLVLVFVKDEQALEIVNILGMIVFQAVFLGVYLFYTRKHNLRSSFSPRNKITVWSVLGAAGVSVAAFFGFIGLAYLFEFALGQIGYHSVGIEASNAFVIVLLAFATVVAAPVCEETIFRSALLSGIKKVRSDDIGPAFISGICFALMHMNPSQTIYQFCLGTAAAYITLKCGNVVASMTVHAVSNLLALIMSFTGVGTAIDAFYMRVGDNALIAVAMCIAAPAAAAALIWLICTYLSKVEKKKYPDKFKTRKILWIDEETKEPIYDGESVPKLDGENKFIRRGYNPFTGEPIIADRLELQQALMAEYIKNNGEKSGKLGKKTYDVAFGLYIGLTVFLWLMTLVAGMII